ncbi:hypothetical protein NPIL_524731 [Nephila pilipes]|uniref:Uncharacterized protein n=1 Tax=Nephila pilipes TaxID=299642 RepID=A0A8X6MLK9_NEPPI|nr:hypothetical protein NPIL_240061 [Nephila pilipes]GFT25265.1 hypothetical protein NPIL_524731 [Nephila pilipes]
MKNSAYYTQGARHSVPQHQTHSTPPLLEYEISDSYVIASTSSKKGPEKVQAPSFQTTLPEVGNIPLLFPANKYSTEEVQKCIIDMHLL